MSTYALLELRGSSESQLPPKKNDTIVIPPSVKHLMGKSGTFSAPDYPQPYKSNSNYTWIIEVPKGHIIQMRVIGISIEYV